ncbi:hypothetical protein D3C75_556340 [compost metagenome]
MTATVSLIGSENISSVPFMSLPKSSIIITTLLRRDAFSSLGVFVGLSLDSAAETDGTTEPIKVTIRAATAIQISK